MPQPAKSLFFIFAGAIVLAVIAVTFRFPLVLLPFAVACGAMILLGRVSSDFRGSGLGELAKINASAFL